MSSSLPDTASVTRLLDGYHPFGHVPDELLDPDGQVRPVWRQFIEHFASLSAQDISESFALGDQYLRDAGVFFRQSDGPVSRVRSWPLSHVPVLIGDREWQQIEAGDGGGRRDRAHGSTWSSTGSDIHQQQPCREEESVRPEHIGLVANRQVPVSFSDQGRCTGRDPARPLL